MHDSNIIVAYSDPGEEKPAPAHMAAGPEGILLVANRLLDRQEVLVFDTSSTAFTLKDIIHIGVGPRFICYHKMNSTEGLIIASDLFWGRVSATSLASKQVVWRLQGEVMGKGVKACGMSSGPKGQVFVADGLNKRILILDGSMGLVLQVIHLPEFGGTWGAIYRDASPHLTMCHRKDPNKAYQISYFDIED